MKKIYIMLILCAMAAGCSHTQKEIAQTYADGAAQQVNTTKRIGDKQVKIGETLYYADGTMQCEKHFADDGITPAGTWSYYYPDGKKYATAQFDAQHPTGAQWQFFSADGSPMFKEAYDELQVAELSAIGTPSTIILKKDSQETYYQLYDNGAPRSYGQQRNGQREGQWLFFHPNGNKQTEATFANGKEEGEYTVYYKNGKPYYRGQYLNGERTGSWEFYDEQGTMIATKQF